MKFYYITFRSVTFAQQGEALLTRKNIPCGIRRTPRWMEEQGCGYCLRIRTGDPRGMAKLLREAGIPMRRMYRERSSGVLEEVEL